MKKFYIVFFLLFSFSLIAQDLPSPPSSGFAFPLGSKFTIELIPVDSVNFNISIIKYDPFDEVIDYFKAMELFAEEGKPGTIEFYFCLGTRGETEEEKEKT